MPTIRCRSCKKTIPAATAETKCPKCGTRLRRNKKIDKSESSASQEDFDPMAVLMADESPDTLANVDDAADSEVNDSNSAPTPSKKAAEEKATAVTDDRKASPKATQTVTDESTASAAQQLVEGTQRPRVLSRQPPTEPAFDFGSFADRLKANKAAVGAAVVCLALVAGFALRGCDDDRVPTYPVSGRVVFEDGTPVRLGVVELESVADATTSQGTIRQDGTFVLGTYTSDDGAPAGTHPAIVVQLLISDGTIQHTTDHGKPVSPTYGSYQTSGLKVVVDAVEQNDIEIRLEPTQ